MSENMLENYNPLYDVHLRQYFALPHMQKHLKDLGLVSGLGTFRSVVFVAHMFKLKISRRCRESFLKKRNRMDHRNRLTANNVPRILEQPEF